MQRYASSGLVTILKEASQALAHLDADRLEQMARYCEMLLGDHEAERVISKVGAIDRSAADFARVLEATRANLELFRRVRETAVMQLEYRPEPGGCAQSAGSQHGNY